MTIMNGRGKTLVLHPCAFPRSDTQFHSPRAYVREQFLCRFSLRVPKLQTATRNLQTVVSGKYRFERQSCHYVRQT